MVDIAYLARAVVHCDVVVTEKQWVHELRRSELLEEHGTTALHDVAELPQVLVELVGMKRAQRPLPLHKRERPRGWPQPLLPTYSGPAECEGGGWVRPQRALRRNVDQQVARISASSA